MTALEFMWACIGSGVAMVCVSYSYKIINDVRLTYAHYRKTHHKEVQTPQQQVAVPLDEHQDQLIDQLERFRGASFAPPMVPQKRRELPRWKPKKTKGEK